MAASWTLYTPNVRTSSETDYLDSCVRKELEGQVRRIYAGVVRMRACLSVSEHMSDEEALKILCWGVGDQCGFWMGV